MIRKAYAWEKDGKFYLSAIEKSPNRPRPANEHETKKELMDEVKKRELKVQWDG